MIDLTMSPRFQETARNPQSGKATTLLGILAEFWPKSGRDLRDYPNCSFHRIFTTKHLEMKVSTVSFQVINTSFKKFSQTN